MEEVKIERELANSPEAQCLHEGIFKSIRAFGSKLAFPAGLPLPVDQET
jgi:hypothetical protein